MSKRSKALRASFESADEELAEVLHSLGQAHRYRAWIYSLIEPYLGQEVLEIGAGKGELSELLKGRRRVVTSDLSPRFLSHLESAFHGVEGFEVAAVDLAVPIPAELGLFDSAVLVNVLEHIEDDLGALGRLRGALRPGGRVLLFVPAFPALYSRFDAAVGHYRRYRKRPLARLIREAGLEVERIHYVNSVGFFSWWLYARVLGRTPTDPGMVRVFDRYFVPVLRAVESRVHPPIGQSLFCAGRRP